MLNLPIRPLFAAAGKLLFVAFVAPWLVLAVTLAVCRKCDHVVRGLLALRFALATEMHCPQGHATATTGMYECRGCGGLFAGWAFQACNICGASCGHIACERCGLAIRNPLA